MKKFALLVLVLLLSAYPLYSRPKLETSLSNVHPAYNEWYKRYSLSLTMNPSDRFGLRVRLGLLDFGYKDFSLNSRSYGYAYPYNSIDALLYFTRNNVSLYSILSLSASYDGSSGYYDESSSFYLYLITGFGIDWYFSDRAACFAEIQDLLGFYYSRYNGENRFDADGNPGIVFGLKFGIY
jgi:hypothetical protein